MGSVRRRYFGDRFRKAFTWLCGRYSINKIIATKTCSYVAVACLLFVALTDILFAFLSIHFTSLAFFLYILA